MKTKATKKKASTAKEDSKGLKRLNFLKKSKWVAVSSPESFGVAFLLISFEGTKHFKKTMNEWFCFEGK